MPLQSEAQLTGYEGERWFRSQLPRGWIPQKPETDVGIDYLVVISENGDLDKRQFQVQVKASKSFTRHNGQIQLRPIKKSTIDYWFLSPLPTLIVAYDEKENRGYFKWHSELYRDFVANSMTNHETVSVSVSEKSVLDVVGWDTIRHDLHAYYRNLAHALKDARNARSVLPTIHDLAAAVRQLNSIDHQQIPIAARSMQQHAILGIMEMMQHRLIVATLLNLRAEILPDSEAHKILNEWTSSYESRVSAAFPTFSTLKNWNEVPPDFQIEVEPNIAQEQRPKLIESVLEMIMLLAPGQFNAVDHESG